MKKELVSIITPMYNAEQTISKTIESVLSQTYQDWELIIVDDNSRDKSPEIVRKYQEKDRRIKYHKHIDNQGVAKSRNDAIKLAKGRYVAFLDSDDEWKKDKLLMQIKQMQIHNAAFSCTACNVIDEADRVIHPIRHVPSEINYKSLLKGNYIPCLTVMIDRSAIEIPAIKEIPHEDYELWLEIIKQEPKAIGIDIVLASYREISKKAKISGHVSISSNKFRAMGWTWDILYYHQQLGLLKSCYYFCHYLINAIKKRI